MSISAIILPAPGVRVGVVCGPGEFASDHAGIVLCHVEGRFGSWAEVLMDSGEVKRCSGIGGKGIGWHMVGGAK